MPAPSGLQTAALPASTGVIPVQDRPGGGTPSTVGVAIAAAGVAGAVVVSWRRIASRGARVATGGKWIGLGGLAAGFSRISGDELLEHPNRKTLIALIREQPGIHFRALQRAVGTGSASVQYHLQVLVRAGFVHRHEWKGAVGYYAEGSEAVPGHDTLRSETARSILEQILGFPGSTANDIALRLGCDPSLVAYHLRQFQGAGLIDRVTSAGAQRIMPRQEAFALVRTTPQAITVDAV
ncbi:MAG: winged helix-turn-helix transcriptional regulator [bacterium]